MVPLCRWLGESALWVWAWVPVEAKSSWPLEEVEKYGKEVGRMWRETERLYGLRGTAGTAAKRAWEEVSTSQSVLVLFRLNGNEIRRQALFPRGIDEMM